MSWNDPVPRLRMILSPAVCTGHRQFVPVRVGFLLRLDVLLDDSCPIFYLALRFSLLC